MHVDSFGITQPLSCDGLLLLRWWSQTLMISWFLLTCLLIHCLYSRRSTFARWFNHKHSRVKKKIQSPCLSFSLKILHSKKAFHWIYRKATRSAHGPSSHVPLCRGVTVWLISFDFCTVNSVLNRWPCCLFYWPPLSSVPLNQTRDSWPLRYPFTVGADLRPPSFIS